MSIIPVERKGNMDYVNDRSTIRTFPFIAPALLCAMCFFVDVSADGATVNALVDTIEALKRRMSSMVDVPVGTIIAYGGNLQNENTRSKLLMEGWLPCDGSEFKKSDYPDLYAVITIAFGGDKDRGTFNLPDMRGRFLRGVDESSKRDPNAATRISSAKGGNSGNIVGSVQDDEQKGHTHGTWDTQLGGPDEILVTATGQSQSTYGNETRPKNIYVHWIIKAKKRISLK
jgi:microcystin-dependent protein